MQAVTIDETTGWRHRLLGGDRPRDLIPIVGAIAGFVVLDRLLRATAALAGDDGSDPVLVAAAIARNWFPAVLIAVGIAGVLLIERDRITAGWSCMEQGAVWRWMVAPWVVTLAWYTTTSGYNFVLGQWHLIDRLLILALAVAVAVHPLFLVPFVLQIQIFTSQHQLVLGASPTAGTDRLAVAAIVVVAVTFLVASMTEVGDTAPGLLLLGIVVAAHFFAPGRAKVAIDWVTDNDLHHFAQSSYTTGWRGAGDGSWADRAASVLQTFRWPAVIGTMVLEVGAAVAVFHRKMLRWFLPAWVLLHAGIFLVSGFFLFAWVVVELGLLVVLWRPDLSAWVARNDTVARGAIAVGAVALGWSWFSPPRLAWLDAPVSYGYEIEAVGLSGASYHVPLDEFGPLQQDLSFLLAQFRDDPLVVRGYGAVDFDALQQRLGRVDGADRWRAIEAEFPSVDAEVRRTSELIITSWLDRVNSAGAEPWYLISPPSRYWVDRPEPAYDRNEPIRSVEVVLVRSIHDSGPAVERETVLRVEVDGRGQAVVTMRSDG